jgi:hypothetical protein
MNHKSQTQQYVAARKKQLLESFPDVKSGHLSEALAAGLGDNTHIGLLTRLDTYDAIPPQVLRYEAVQTRLWELGYEQYAPLSVRRKYVYEVPCEDGSSPDCWSTVERSVEGLPELDSEQLLEIRDKNSVTLTEDYVEATGIQIRKEEQKELNQYGYILRQAYFNVDYNSCGACGSDS